MLSAPIDDQIACIERELRIRKGFYAKKVAAGTMKQPEADREIFNMESVLSSLHTLKGIAAVLSAEQSKPAPQRGRL